MGHDEDNNFLKRVRVASPCNASWDAMTGDDKVRLCGQCDRNIYNIELMSMSEATTLLRNTTERTCIRLHRRSDGTVMTADCPTGLQAYRQRAGRMVAAAFAMVLGIFSFANAQRFPRGDSSGTRSETFIEVPRIEGSVLDQAGAPIENALVTVTTSSRKKITTKTNAKGYFQLIDLRMLGGSNSISVESKPFRRFGDQFTITRREMITFPIVLDAGVIGVYVNAEPPIIDMKSSSNTFRIIVNDE